MSGLTNRTPQPTNINSSAEVYSVVTPADVDLPFLTRKIRVGSDGSLVVQRQDGTTVTITALAGEQFNIMARQVKAATTCTDVLVMY